MVSGSLFHGLYMNVTRIFVDNRDPSANQDGTISEPTRPSTQRFAFPNYIQNHWKRRICIVSVKGKFLKVGC